MSGLTRTGESPDCSAVRSRSVNTAFERWKPGTSPRALSEALFDGALVIFEDLSPVTRLVQRARAILNRTFETDEPGLAERHLSASDFRSLAMQAREAVATDGIVARHWWDTLAIIGFRKDATWLDRIRLRVVPSRDDIGHQRLQTVPPHRDTWGSGIMAQINWWLPLYPLVERSTMLLWPDAFRLPIANTSGEWSFQAFRNGKQDGYPLLPVACSRPDRPGVPVLIEPGQLLGFSAAHLHAGVRDESGWTRFGVDTRSVWEPDRIAGRGALNVDGAARGEMWRWFRAPGVQGEE